jgi:hypothetical protein
MARRQTVTASGLARAAERPEDAYAERDRLIVAALVAGWTHRAIAEATGLSHARIGQIAGKYGEFRFVPYDD